MAKQRGESQEVGSAYAEVYDRGMHLSLGALDPTTLDPEKHYRWVHPRNLVRRKTQGYEVVLRTRDGVRFLHEDDMPRESADDMLRRGESFLMACKKTVYRERRRRIEKLAQSRLSASEQQFKTRAQRENVQPLIGDEGERRR